MKIKTLDVIEYCDCFELGSLLEESDPKWGVYVWVEGSSPTSSKALEIQLEFDQWNFKACIHDAETLVSDRLGNVS